jgi:hypothetical protein
MTIIKDGTGSGKEAAVDATNRLEVHGVIETEVVESAENGDAYNFNTGTIGLTNSTASGILYIQNNEIRDLNIDAIAAGIGSAGTVTDVATVTVIRNPTSVSFSTDADMNQNRNFGSSKTFIGNVYKGAQGATVTGGDAIVQFFAAAGTRLFAPIDLILTKGDSLAVTIDSNTTSGTTNVYAAAVCHLKRTS